MTSVPAANAAHQTITEPAELPHEPAAGAGPSVGPAEGDGPTRRHTRRRWLIGGAAVVVGGPLLWYVGTQPIVGSELAGITASGGATGGATGGAAPLAGHVAPDFTLKDTAGKPFKLTQLRGKPVLLNFWATWCQPCREEMPELERLYRQYKSDGLVVLGVSIDDKQAGPHIPDFLQAGDPNVGPYTFPVVLDDQQAVVKQYKLVGVPQSYFIDQSGVIQMVQPRAMSRQNMLDGLKIILPDLADGSVTSDGAASKGR